MIKFSGRNGIKYRSLPLIKRGFDLFGLSWSSFYAWMLNVQERRNSIEAIKKLKSAPGVDGRLYDLARGENSHLFLLKREGLAPNHKILDFGCGFGRTAVPLLGYLEPENYTGIDISKERIRLANDYVKLEGLEEKKPIFLTSNTDNDFSFLEPESFDFIFAWAVLCHMPFDDVEKCLRGMKSLLKKGGVFLVDFIASDSGIYSENIKDFRVPTADMYDLIERIGFTYEVLSAWDPAVLPENRIKNLIMLKLTHVD